MAKGGYWLETYVCNLNICFSNYIFESLQELDLICLSLSHVDNPFSRVEALEHDFRLEQILSHQCRELVKREDRFWRQKSIATPNSLNDAEASPVGGLCLKYCF